MITFLNITGLDDAEETARKILEHTQAIRELHGAFAVFQPFPADVELAADAGNNAVAGDSLPLVELRCIGGRNLKPSCKFTAITAAVFVDDLDDSVVDRVNISHLQY